MFPPITLPRPPTLLVGAAVLPVASLSEAVAQLRGDSEIGPAAARCDGHAPDAVLDLAEVRGQKRAGRALEIAAARDNVTRHCARASPSKNRTSSAYTRSWQRVVDSTE